jgi:hypothetical protein
MTGIYNAVGVADFVAGGETKWNPRIEFEHVFSAARETFEQSSSSTSPQ